jgi:hypothetical protein
MRGFCRLSYARVKYLFDLLGIRCPSKSALQYTAAKLDARFWQRVLKITCGNTYMIALDSTGLSRTNPSYHYLKRIDGKIPAVPVKVSVAFDTRKKKFAAAKIRVLPAHDMKDVPYLLKHTAPKVLAADKAYDANSIHEHCKTHKIRVYIPLRAWSKPRRGALSPRMQSAKHFKNRFYHRREMVESGFGGLKRTTGSNVCSRKARTIRSEVYGRLACHNLFSWFFRLLGYNLPC